MSDLFRVKADSVLTRTAASLLIKMEKSNKEKFLDGYVCSKPEDVQREIDCFDAWSGHFYHGTGCYRISRSGMVRTEATNQLVGQVQSFTVYDNQATQD